MIFLLNKIKKVIKWQKKHFFAILAHFML
jgi:hypothetical protein